MVLTGRKLLGFLEPQGSPKGLLEWAAGAAGLAEAGV